MIFMLSLRKHFRRAKRVSNLVPSSFNVDDFIELIVRKQEGKTTWEENRYIRRMVRENPKAAQAWQDAKDTSPHERFSLWVYHVPLTKMVAVFLVMTLIAAGIYALIRYYNISVSVHVEEKQMYNPNFKHKQLAEVANMIEDTYSRKVIFDREEVRSKLIWGRFNPAMKLDDFLEDLRYNNVDNYIDDMGYIHIK